MIVSQAREQNPITHILKQLRWFPTQLTSCFRKKHCLILKLSWDHSSLLHGHLFLPSFLCSTSRGLLSTLNTLPYSSFPHFVSLDHGFPPIFKKPFSTDANKVILIYTIFFPSLSQIFSCGFTFLKPQYFHSNTYCCEAPSGI